MGFFTSMIYVLISFFLGFIFIGISLNWIHFTLTIPYLKGEILSSSLVSDNYLRSLFLLLGILIILFCLRYFQYLLRRSCEEKAIVFDSPQGRVSITLLAVEDMLRKVLEEKKELSHIKPKVRVRKRIIDIVIRGNLTSEVNLLEFSQETQDKIKEKIQEFLGEGREIKVKIDIRKVVFGSKKEPEEPEVPFRNY